MTPSHSHPDLAPAGPPVASQPRQPVLLCYDGSLEARNAIARAAELLQPRTALVLDARESSSAGPLTEEGAQVAQRAGFGEVSSLASNSTLSARGILRAAQEHGAGLIVVGSGRGASATPLPPPAPVLPGDLARGLVQRGDIPVLVVPSEDGVLSDPGSGLTSPTGPTFVCFDGSAEAKRAVDAAARVLAARDAIAAAFLEPIDDVALLRDDVALLRATLPWPPPAETEQRLAELDERQAEFVAQQARAGAALAASRGLRSRPLAVEGPGEAFVRLLAAARAGGASCVVVGHRRSAQDPHQSTALELVHHTHLPVLVVPG